MDLQELRECAFSHQRDVSAENSLVLHTTHFYKNHQNMSITFTETVKFSLKTLACEFKIYFWNNVK